MLKRAHFMKNQLLLILLLATVGENSMAQQSWALKPYVITLPRVTTTQQTNPTTVPQQAGNIVYNTDQQAVAVNNGTNWAYLNSGNDEYRNIKTFFYGQSIWSVPAGVTQIVVEAWGAGGGGGNLSRVNESISCRGGGPGGYLKRLLSVTPGISLTINVGNPGQGGLYGSRLPTSGTGTSIKGPSILLTAAGGGSYGSAGDFTGDTDGKFGATGEELVMSYQPRGGTDYVLNLKLGNGGVAYGGSPGGYGGQVALLNGATVLWFVDATFGSYPGGGGGCGYYTGGDGRQGFVIIRW